MKNLFTLILAILLVSTGFSQTTVLEKEIPANIDDSNWGPNRLHYGHFYLEVGFQPEFDGNGQHNSLTSTNAKIGYRYKLKIFNFYALGAEAYALRHTFRLNDDKFIYPQILSVIPEWDSQLIRFLSVGGAVFQRINFDRRGNYLGKYLDLGINANYVYASRNIYTYEPKDGSASVVKVKEKNLATVEDTFWGVMARIGSNKYAITFNYRMSPFFENKEVFEPYQIGFEIAF